MWLPRAAITRIIIVAICFAIAARALADEAQKPPLRPALVRSFAAAAVLANSSPPLNPADPSLLTLQKGHGGTEQSGGAGSTTPHEQVGQKQGKSNLSALSLSLIILLCLFTCICVGAIFVREQQKPEQAVTVVTERGGAVGLDQLKEHEEAATAERARTIDLEEQKQAGEGELLAEPKPIDKVFGQPAGEETKETEAAARALEHPQRARHLRSYPSPSRPSSASSSRNQREGNKSVDDDAADAIAEVKTSTTSVMGEQSIAGPPHPQAIAANVSSAEDDVPYQPTIIMHATQ